MIDFWSVEVKLVGKFFFDITKKGDPIITYLY